MSNGLVMKWMRMRNRTGLLLLAGVGWWGWIGFAGTALREVPAAFKPDAEWRNYPTRTLEDLPVAATAPADSGLSRYGGLMSQRARATGFFRTEKIGDRWWLVDPEGCRFIHRGVASTRRTDTPGADAALQKTFGGTSNWAVPTVKLLREHGFNGLGGWSDAETLRGVEQPLVYTRLWNFMSSYCCAARNSSRRRDVILMWFRRITIACGRRIGPSWRCGNANPVGPS